MTCPSCGTVITVPAKFCPECGAPIAEPAAPAPEERKVVTVLFCDLVGSTARAEGADPEDVRALLHAYHERVRSELERFGGTVEKFIGDAVMALFGAPTAHEDDPERAVRAALAIRDWAQEDGDLQVRIGITTGEALVALSASPLAGEGMASGDVVNTAARLQSAASVNGILVDAATYRATKLAIDYAEHLPVEARGKADPVHVWQPVASLADAREGMRAPLVGREEELDFLRDVLTQAITDRSPQLVTLVGVPGIGKSRLVQELRISAADSVTWRQGRSLPYGAGVSFWAFGEIVKAHAGIHESDPPVVAEGKLRSAVVGAVRNERDAEWVERHLAPLVGIGSDETAGEERRAESFAAWRRFVEALAAVQPLAIVFEDLHWANDGLLDFVESLLEWLTDIPLLLVGTARPELLERRPNWGAAATSARVLSLAPLDDDQTATLIGRLFARPLLPAEQQAALIEQAGGNPLYAEQYVRMLRERGETGEVPETVQGLITARLDALPEAEKSLVHSASVLGKVFSVGAVAAVAAHDRWTIDEQLRALERKEFVRRSEASSVAGESEYAFVHVLIRDVAYGQIPRAARADKHRLAAEWIESLGRPEDHAETLADHYAVALDLASVAGQETAGLAERTHAALSRAGDRAFALNSFGPAARFYGRALALPTAEDGDRPHLLFQLGRALAASGDERSSDVLDEATEALLRAGDPEAAAAAQLLLTSTVVVLNRERRLEHFARAQALVGDRPCAARARVLIYAASLAGEEGEADRALALAEEALQLADALELAEVRSRVLATLGDLKYRRGDETWLSDLEDAVEIALEADSPHTPSAYNALASSLLDAGDVGRTAQLHAEAMRAAERFGRLDLLRFLRSWHPAIEQLQGRWDECLRVAAEFLAECESSPHYGEPWARGDRAVVRFARDDVDGAFADFERALELAREAQAPSDFLWAFEVLARFFAEAGRLEEANAAFDEVIRHRGGEIGWTYTLVYLAWAGQRLGRSAEVLDFIEPVRAPSTWLDAVRAIARGEYATAADTFAEIGSLTDEAYARLRAAKRLAEQGRRAEADSQLQQALGFYRSVGATRYIREGEALLAKTA